MALDPVANAKLRAKQMRGIQLPAKPDINPFKDVVTKQLSPMKVPVAPPPMGPAPSPTVPPTLDAFAPASGPSGTAATLLNPPTTAAIPPLPAPAPTASTVQPKQGTTLSDREGAALAAPFQAGATAYNQAGGGLAGAIAAGKAYYNTPGAGSTVIDSIKDTGKQIVDAWNRGVTVGDSVSNARAADGAGADSHDFMVRAGTKATPPPPPPPPAAPQTPAVTPAPTSIPAPATPTTSTQVTRNPVGANFITGAAPDPKQEAPTGEVFIERGASPGQRMLDRSGATQSFRATVDGVKGQATGRTSAGAQRGGYVGAATDAEAARALQDRAAQSAAAQQMIGSMNAGAEAERDLRATKLGISRDRLDAMEGRGGSYASEGPMTVVGKEGVNFGDEARQNSQIEGLANRAASQTGWGASKRAEAMLGAAQALQAPGMERAKNDAELGKQSMAAQAAINAAQIKAQGDQASAQMKEAGDNYRAKVNYASSTDSARIAQTGQNERLQYSESKDDARTGAKALEDQFKLGAEQLEAMTSSKGKGQFAEVEKSDLSSFLGELNSKQLAEKLNIPEATVNRWKTMKFLPNEVAGLGAKVKAWKAAKHGYVTGLFATDPSATSFMTGVAGD